MNIDQFEQYRPLLFSLAYRMLGTVTDAEDIVQETYLKLRMSEPQAIQNPRAYLTTIATRLCLNRLSSAASQRETYLGPWLPEPVSTAGRPHLMNPSEKAAMSDSISTAFLLLLEQLSPTERAAFLLHDVFDYKFKEIAIILNKSDSACRKLCSRARNHLKANRPRFESSPEEHERLLQGFITVSETGDIDSFLQLLAEDITLIPDGGGERGAAVHILKGRDHVISFIKGVQGIQPKGLRYQILTLNGRPSLVSLKRDGTPYYALFAYGDGRQTTLLHVIAGEKLKGLTISE